MRQPGDHPAPARPSATVVMLRDAAKGPELLLVRRRAEAAFGDAYAFPGGTVDPTDSLAAAYCGGRTAEEASAELDVPERGLEYFVAAIRELFEETGILLARDDRGAWGAGDGSGLRSRVIKGKLSWSDFLRRQRLKMACDALHYFAHWETPLPLPRRWSTRFFLARTPSGQQARHDETELTDCRWLSAAEALDNAHQGHLKLPFPTYRSLEMLRDFDSVGALIAWAADRAARGVPRFLPVQLAGSGKPKFVIPGDPDYPDDDAAR